MFFKKKSTKEKIATKKTNYEGERMDRLDASGNLPFGWVVHNQKYVDMIGNAGLLPERRFLPGRRRRQGHCSPHFHR